ncbi:MAG: SLAP domain-containing protein [Lactobacillus sp.]|jgi:glycerophosphoryl diester phosphodiesterase|nr:SLAP domain-containing protein [Lactobacillus sp.]MCH4068623.1 SLAP domain-containing protein [Lactobacillus sp.]MCI1304082.1 SLAP domain-containing protein [Lactobacillus sp.]MCI1330239.1 SLAP domain-containing protein [Lactobacillus sp.]MCI1400139.1 SLAP domain-containing protein [Lactobacillus sp.]
MNKKNTLWLLAVLPFLFGFTNIAHRGATEGNQSYEHSYAAYDRALSEHADYLELDLEQTKDGVLVVSHDENLKRLYGVNANICNLTFAQLQRYRSKAGEPIHSLQEIFQRYSGDPKIKFMIETRGTGVNQRGTGMEHALVNLVNQYGLQNRVLFESFTPQSLTILAQLAPNIPRTLLGGNYQDIGNNQYWVSYGYNAAAANYLKQSGKKYLIWGVNDAAAMKNIVNSGNVDGLITDFPGRLAQILGVNYYPARQINGYIVIKYNGKGGVNVWNGYGTNAVFSGRRVKNGTRLQVTQVAIQNGKTWYNLGNNQWIDGQYAATYPIKQVATSSSARKYGIIQIRYNHGGVNLWKEPGDRGFTGRRLRNGSRWRYYATTYINGRTYYNLGGNQWVDGRYAVRLR